MHKYLNPKKSISFILTGLLLLTFTLNIHTSFASQSRLFPTIERTQSLTLYPSTHIVIKTSTPTLISGVLTCDAVVTGVTCTDNGSYLDYNININVTGLSGGATAYNITIGTYRRSTNGGEMGMMSDFVHSETSGWAQNTVASHVGIQPFDAGSIGYANFASAAGMNVSVINKTTEWRYVSGSGGWPNTLYVGGNVDWPITGYSIVGHIYLYSNQSFVNGTPTPTRTPTATRTPTKTPTLARTSTATSTPPPNHGGSGVCWASENSWEGYTIPYTIDRNTIPASLGWDASIHAAAQTWSYVTPSHFVFVPSIGSSNIISYGQTQNQDSIAETSANPLFGWSFITEKSTVLNSSLDWDTNNIPDPNNPDSNGSTTTINVQNAMTHEFGHWLSLWDIYDAGCESVTMWNSGDFGEIKKITLTGPDRAGINWQYP